MTSYLKTKRNEIKRLNFFNEFTHFSTLSNGNLCFRLKQRTFEEKTLKKLYNIFNEFSFLYFQIRNENDDADVVYDENELLQAFGCRVNDKQCPVTDLHYILLILFVSICHTKVFNLFLYHFILSFIHSFFFFPFLF